MALGEITHNWFLKLLSFGIAVSLFIVLNVESATPIEISFPIEYRTANGLMLTGDFPTQLEVTLRGPWVKFRDFSKIDPIVVDLKDYKEPSTIQYALKTSDIGAPFGMKAMRFRPSTWDITVDQKVERLVRVEALLPNRPAYGYAIADVIIEPPDIRVSGPLGSVSDLDYLQTTALDLAGRTDNLDTEIDLRAPAFPLRLTQKRVRVVVKVEEEVIQRVFASVEINHKIDHKMPVRLDPPAVAVVIRGPRLSLDKLTAEKLNAWVSVEPELLKESLGYEKSIELKEGLPPGTTMVGPIPTVMISKKVD